VILLAHAGHWLVNAAYFAPVVGFLGWLGWTELRSRREKRAGGDDGANTTPAG
jgi:hypothetical protein